MTQALDRPSPSLACRANRKVDQRVTRDQAQQRLGLAVREVGLEPYMELTNVCLKGDATQPAVQPEMVQPQWGQEVSVHDEQGDWDPACVGMDLIRVGCKRPKARSVHEAGGMRSVRTMLHCKSVSGPETRLYLTSLYLSLGRQYMSVYQ